jgi:hypothetical protein
MRQAKYVSKIPLKGSGGGVAVSPKWTIVVKKNILKDYTVNKPARCLV